MPTLLLQCVAPLQAWGIQSNFTVRDTGREPSKSGIIGLLCAALGRPRTDTEIVKALGSLIMGVRVDREGQVLRDFHTAGQGAADPYKGYLQADGKSVDKGTIISNRYYLTDAMFLVGLTGDEALLTSLRDALANPRWMLCLGRKACVPARPVYLPDGLQATPLLESLRTYPWLGSSRKEHQRLIDDNKRLRVVVEANEGSEMRKDNPVSFEKGKRRFIYRRCSQTFLDEIPTFRPLFAKTKENIP